MITDKPVVVVVGDASKLAKELESVGRVSIFDIEGKPLKQSVGRAGMAEGTGFEPARAFAR